MVLTLVTKRERTAMEQFTTERLTVRDWRPDIEDAKKRQALETALHSVLSPDVLEHLPEPLQLAHVNNNISEWISARAEESDVLLVSEIEPNALIGLLILASDPDSNPATIHIGYLFAEAAWGKGFATELVTGLVSASGADAPIQLVGGVGKGNAASARVLEKAGFHQDQELSTDHTDMFVCVIA